MIENFKNLWKYKSNLIYQFMGYANYKSKIFEKFFILGFKRVTNSNLLNIFSISNICKIVHLIDIGFFAVQEKST